MPLFRKKSVETRLVGSTLVAAFHDSRPPLVWKFDLERNHSFTVTLEGDDGDCELGVTSPKGEFYSIARFVDRADATQALAAVQKILMKKKSGGFKKILMFLFLAALLALSVTFLGNHLLHNHASPATAMIPRFPAMGPEDMESGVPLPADRVLRAPP